VKRLRRVGRQERVIRSVEVAIDSSLEFARSRHCRRIEQAHHARALAEAGEHIVEHQFIVGIEAIRIGQHQLIHFSALG
jgi:hypothetical protein